MIELKARDLTIGDEYTSDQGETWWKVIVNDTSSKFSRRVTATCVYSQIAGIAVADQESGLYDNDELVIVR